MAEARQMMMVPSESPITAAPVSITDPVDEQEPMDVERRVGPGRPRGSKKDPDALFFSKLARAINIAFKLYASGGIGDNLELLGPSGQPIQNSDLISLINYALSKGRARIGEAAFIQALMDADVPLGWISNDDIRMKLSSLSAGIGSVKRTSHFDTEPAAKRPRANPEVIIRESRALPRNVEVIPINEAEPVEVPPREQILPGDDVGLDTPPPSLPPGERPPLKNRLRKRKTPYTLRNPRWDVLPEDG